MIDLERMWVLASLLAHLVAGEAGTCGMDGKSAVAHVHATRGAVAVGWYGNAEPSDLDWEVALTWKGVADPTQGARYLFSAQDLQLPAVKRLLEGREQTATFDCAGGLQLTAWR